MFITEYGSHLGYPQFFLVREEDFLTTVTVLRQEHARWQILENDVKFLHQALMTEHERDTVHEVWKENS